MRQIFNFISKNGDRLLFILLLGISLTLTIQSHSYHKSKFIGAVNAVSGGVYEKVDNVHKYLGLASKNDSLAKENAILLNLLFSRQQAEDKPKIDSIFGIGKDDIEVSKVIHNMYNLPQNYLTIDSGAKDSIKSDMGVINDRGVVGVIDRVSSNFGIVTSILNNKSLINAKIKNTNYFGTLSWNAKSTGFVQLIDVPRTLSVKKGDTIVTGGLSEIFPGNIYIGTVYKISTYNNSFVINIKLFNDMTNMGYVYVIKNKNWEKKSSPDIPKDEK